jgi:hypothetical protein
MRTFPMILSRIFSVSKDPTVLEGDKVCAGIRNG